MGPFLGMQRIPALKKFGIQLCLLVGYDKAAGQRITVHLDL